MKKFICFILSIISVLGVLAACKPKTRDDDQFLEILINNLGYGYGWAEPIITEFKNTDWVKEKYPNLDVSYKPHVTTSIFSDEVMSEKTKYDLLFSTSSIKQFITTFDTTTGYSKYFAELSDVYDSVVPGEEIELKRKMMDFFYNKQKVEQTNGKVGFYEYPWILGNMGMLYNMTEFEKLNLKVPVTTKELESLCAEIITKGKTPFVFSSQVNYWTTSLFLTWWAQYQGVEEYMSFYEGIHTDEDGRARYSPDVFKQTGRLRSLEQIHNLIGVKGNDSASPNNHDRVNTLSFTGAQSQFLLGNGLMMANGDWFEEEMRATKEQGITDEFNVMKTPVLSTIVENLPSKSQMSEQTLAAVVRAVDNYETGYEGVSKEDYEFIKTARNIIVPIDSHVAYIPAYSSAKELAKDFLKYLATDKAQKIFFSATRGSSMPFKYDFEKEYPEGYLQISDMQRNKIQNFKDAVLVNNFFGQSKINYYGGISALNAQVRKIESLFAAQNPKDRLSPQEIYDADIKYWDSSRWENALLISGLL